MSHASAHDIPKRMTKNRLTDGDIQEMDKLVVDARRELECYQMDML